MMPTKRHALLLITLALCVLVLAVGCRQGAPVQNTSNTAMTPAATKMDTTKMHDAILRAGSGSGWQMKDDGPGRILGVYNVRSHSATVAVTYDEKTYQINYVSSINLEAKDGKIHPNYNKWVNQLNNNIAREVSLTK